MTLDCRNIAREAYDLADSEELIAPLVREALQVIDQALDTYGWVTSITLPVALI